MKKTFADTPYEIRQEIYNALTDAGGYVAMYAGESVIVAVPRDIKAFRESIETLPLETDGVYTYFPLGSDKPQQSLRHDGPYGKYPKGNRSFWCHQSFKYTG